MRSHGFATETNTLANEVGAYQAGNGGVDMYDSTTGEVQGAVLEQPTRGCGGGRSGIGCGIGIRTSPVPHHVRHGDIGEGKPDHHEDEHSREADAFGKGTQDQAAGDGGEGPLEHHIDQLGNTDTLAEGCGNRVRGDVIQEYLVKATEEGIPFGEGQTVAIDDPEYGGQGKYGEGLHQYREHILVSDQAAVEEGNAGNRHQDHQGRGYDQPGVVALVDCAGWGSHWGGGRGSCCGCGISRCHRGGCFRSRSGFIAPCWAGEAEGPHQRQNCKQAFHRCISLKVSCPSIRTDRVC